MKASLVKYLVSATFLALFPLTSLLAAEQGSAIDAQGVRHDARDYSGRPVPWRGDIAKSIAPEYPYEERTRHHEGSGLFRLTLDLKTGLVTNVLMITSTGFKGLDASGIKSLRQWRWRPGRWRQIDIPLTFTMSRNPDLEQPSSPFIHLPVSSGHRGRP
jgi:TonB family protein